MLLWFVVVIVILAVSGSIYQAVATARDKRNYPPLGQMVSIGKRWLHLQVTGEDVGKPTVVLAAGMGSFSTNSRLHIVKDATHEGLVAEREHALVVVAAIRQVMAAAQTGQPLPDSSLSTLGNVNQ